MNSATEQLGEEHGEKKVADRRRGMKLVACGAPKKRTNALRIDVSDELLGAGPTLKTKVTDSTKNRGSAPSFGAEITVGLAVLTGVLIGYYLNRRRD